MTDSHDDNRRDALAIYFQDGDSFQVGHIFSAPGETPRKGGSVVTRIVISQDLPGLYNSLERARVFVGDVCVCEAPVHMLEFIAYHLNAADEGGAA